MKFLWPDWYFDAFTDIPEGFFKEHHVKYLISDIDNTLVSYDDPVPTPAALAFFDRLKEENVTLLLVSNNKEHRVSLFTKEHPFPAVADAAKPLVFRINKMLQKEGVDLRNAAFLGDQIFTDGLTAKRLSVPMILLKPIAGDKGHPFFGIKRTLENVILKDYLKHNPISTPCRKEQK